MSAGRNDIYFCVKNFCVWDFVIRTIWLGLGIGNFGEDGGERGILKKITHLN